MLEFLDKNFKAAIIIKDVKENMVVMIEKKRVSHQGHENCSGEPNEYSGTEK